MTSVDYAPAIEILRAQPQCVSQCIVSDDTSTSVTADAVTALCSAAFTDMTPIMACIARTCDETDLAMLTGNVNKTGAVLGPLCVELNAEAVDGKWKPEPVPIPTNRLGFADALNPNTTTSGAVNVGLAGFGFWLAVVLI
ncbi:hypothetical protein HDU77_000485 [Chytriomyces hyalinus]|nr:hypothetical protein HDU77_000485 [Chytriomyces hyalinus]